MIPKISTLFVIFEIFFYSLNIHAEDIKTFRLNGLEIDVPRNYQVNSHMIDGMLQTSFRKEGGDLTSMLIVSVANVGYTMDLDDLKKELTGIQESFQMSGFNVAPLSSYQIKSLHGFRTDGNGFLMNHPVKVAFKFLTLGAYYVQFLEYYGEDLSREYESIEQSIRISTSASYSEIETVCEGAFCFTYDATKLFVTSNNINNNITFTFTSTESNSGDSFLEFNFLPTNADNFYAYCIDWFKKMEKVFSSYFSECDFNSMEKVTFLGQPGYMKKGVATINNTNNKVLFTIRVCRYNGKFTWSAKQQTLENNGNPSEEIEQLFNDIETSLIYTPK